jgi:hypothetical protein
MPVLSNPSAAARTALIYITIGALTIVWSVIWFVWLRNNPPERAGTYYWCAGMFLTGLTILVIGLTLGRIGRAARHAELPPQEVTGVEAGIDQNAAARAPIIAPVNPAVPGVMTNVPPTAPNVAVPTATAVQVPVGTNAKNTNPSPSHL